MGRIIQKILNRRLSICNLEGGTIEILFAKSVLTVLRLFESSMGAMKLEVRSS